VVDNPVQLRPFRELDPVEHAGLHITLQGIRFVDETDDADIDLLADAVGRRLSAMDLPELSTAHPETDTDAVQLPILPRDPFVQLRDAIQSTVDSELGGDFLYRLPEPRNGFDPHVTIVYAVLHAAPAPRASFHVRHASLIKLRRRTRRWSWEGERALAIGVR
jgi:2'-5' RNA ligase